MFNSIKANERLDNKVDEDNHDFSADGGYDLTCASKVTTRVLGQG